MKNIFDVNSTNKFMKPDFYYIDENYNNGKNMKYIIHLVHRYNGIEGIENDKKTKEILDRDIETFRNDGSIILVTQKIITRDNNPECDEPFTSVNIWFYKEEIPIRKLTDTDIESGYIKLCDFDIKSIDYNYGLFKEPLELTIYYTDGTCTTISKPVEIEV